MTRIALCTSIALLPLCSGCVLFGVGPVDLQTQMSLADGVALEQELALSTDGLTIALAQSMANMPFPVKGIGWVDVGVYRIVNKPTGGFSGLDLPGWKQIVRITGKDENVQVLVKESGDRVNGLVFVSRDQNEVIIARIKGNLNQFFEEALANHVPTVGWGGFAREVTGQARAQADRETQKAAEPKTVAGETPETPATEAVASPVTFSIEFVEVPESP